MAANSRWRRLIKRLLFPVLTERNYRLVQGLAMAWDIRTGRWSEPEIDLVRFAVREGESVFDIGANYGLYSYHLSRAVRRSGRVYAFEPIPFTSDVFKIVAAALRLRNVELLPKGCSDRAGTVPFTLPIQASGAISAGLAHIGSRNNERAGKERHCRYSGTREVWGEVIVLDELLPRVSALSFIKSDTEGADLLALRGAEKLIERHHPSVLCEINPWFLAGFGIRTEEIIEFFSGKNYRMYRYERHRGGGLLKPVDVDDVTEANYVFIHPERADRFAPLLAPSSS